MLSVQFHVIGYGKDMTFTSLKLWRTSSVGMIVDDDNEEEEHCEALEHESSMLIRRHLARLLLWEQVDLPVCAPTVHYCHQTTQLFIAFVYSML